MADVTATLVWICMLVGVLLYGCALYLRMYTRNVLAYSMAAIACVIVGTALCVSSSAMPTSVKGIGWIVVPIYNFLQPIWPSFFIAAAVMLVIAGVYWRKSRKTHWPAA